MKKIIFLLITIISFQFSSCKKDKETKPEEDEAFGYFTYYGLTVASNPSNYTKSKTATSITNFWAEIKEVNGTSQLKIYHGDQYNNTTITVDFTGVGNYSSDKIFALGGAEGFANRATEYNDQIIEKGFVTLDLVVSKKLTENLMLKLVSKNLLNPEIKQNQVVRNIITNIETNETVLSYKKGQQLSLSVKYTF